ncbi:MULTISPECIES: ABC transporter substrate-binding protein [Streptomyces]|uniref:ABC transporter substrate-binding protein n=1 Tax=Streptomyces griseus subsp. griseus (strain JCM 4626 / CBS 651.72 / NBRC 13350 / KCC S-0626 / ISP 5235) TaxID=455632 RepID=B1VST1_STRGG|nr:sugar ABC transporter substrate-binding protein [Streptomyces griseus]MBW3703289.1 sugar ABC transporter substrate-binding protein [Streptomyces griseus]BAG17635.1 putative ABC transporter substrate-binding protein [Streptomyces griseus subsp. griseus NBRC 13350]SED69402.1 carbohydrate ABC transporter substrate-binding protein, CUT1 family [Streptomyces griseus]SQA24394.1 ABC transporter substrate-binding protein [Streptomyces griseus]
MSTSSRPLSRRAFGRLAASAAGAGVLSACSGGSGRPSADAPLRIMAINHVWSQAVERRVTEFEERIGRRVSMTLLTADQLAGSYNVKLNASGTDVDVMMVRALQEQLLFGHNGWLADLSDRVADQQFAWDDFQDAPREASVTAGKVLSVPVVTERPALYYRKDLVEELGGPPRTLAALMEGARELTRRKEGFYGYVGRGQRSGAVSQWSSFLYSHGGDFVVDGKSGIGSPEATAAYEYYGRLLAGSGPPGATNMSLEQAMPIFAQGKAAFFVDADAVYSNFLDPKVSRVRETVGFAPFPAGPAGAKPHNIPSWSLGINAFSRLRDEAWEFIRWAAGPEMSAALQQEGIPGARSSVWSDPKTLSAFPPELAEAMRINAERGVGHDRPRVLQVGRARDIVGRPLVAGILGQSVRPVVRDADAEFADFLVRDNRHKES